MDLADDAGDDVARRPLAAVRCSAASTRAERRRSLYIGPVPEPAAQPPPRLRHDPPHRAARAGPHHRVECQWLFPPEAVERPGFDPSYAVDFWDLTNRQDWAAVESVQRGLVSPAFVPGVLAEQEDAVYQLR